MPTHLHPDDVIAALASAPGPAARGTVRVSGRDLAALIERVFVPETGEQPNATGPARLHAGSVCIGQSRRPLAVDLYFWPRRSYTGEPLAEFHTIGSPPLVDALLSELFAAGARPAQPGEFTLRAFLAGRVDLVQAEAVLGVIDAQDQAELDAALAQLAGGISTEIGCVRSDLIDLLADLEAGLDFADEAIEFVAHTALIHRLAQSRHVLSQLLERAGQRMRPAAQQRVVLAGPPNAGKSTLFNALVGRDAALVADLRGTTRDYLAAEVAWHGLTLTLVDTAGWEHSTTGISKEAQRLRGEQLDRADLIVWCDPADACRANSPPRIRGGEHDAAACDSSNADLLAVPRGRPLLRVETKSDLIAEPMTSRDTAVRISALTGAGLPDLTAAIVARLSSPVFGERQWIGTTAARCRDSLLGALAALDRAATIAECEVDQELLAIEVRDTLDELGQIVGAVYTDDILDRIFSKFCIGK